MLAALALFALARTHAGHTHEYSFGCTASIFAGPTVGQHVYFVDWSTEVVFAARIGTWETEKTWAIDFDFPQKANFALTNHPDGRNVILFHYKHENEWGGSLKYAIFNVDTDELVMRDMDEASCPVQNGLPKARTSGGNVYLADIGTVHTGVYLLDMSAETCTRVGCEKPVLTSSMMGLATDANGMPQDYLQFWSFDVRDIDEQTKRVYYLSREFTAPYRHTVFHCDSDTTAPTATITAWNIDIHPRAPVLNSGQKDLNYKPAHGYGDIFHVGPDDGLILVNGEYDFASDADTNPNSENAQDPDVLSGKIAYLSRNAQEHVSSSICGYGMRHPYHNWINRSTKTLNIGDVGDSAFEELNVVTCSVDSTPVNMGWPLFEGHLINAIDVDLPTESVVEFPRLSLEHCKGDKVHYTNDEYRALWIAPLILSIALYCVATWYWSLPLPLFWTSASHLCALVATLVSWSIPDLFRYKEQQIDYRFGVWYGSITNEGGDTAFSQLHSNYQIHKVWNSQKGVDFYLPVAVVQSILIFMLFTPLHGVSFLLALAVPLLMDATAMQLSNAFDTQLSCYTLAWSAVILVVFSLPSSFLYKWAKSRMQRHEPKDTKDVEVVGARELNIIVPQRSAQKNLVF